MLSPSNDMNKMAFVYFAYFIILCLTIYVYYGLGLASNDPLAFTKHLNSNIITIVIPVILVFILIAFTSVESTTAAYFIFGSLFIAGIFLGSAYFLQTNLSKYIFNKYLLYIVIGAILLIGLSIVVTLFSGSLRKLTGWTGFFINLIFYIPCLIRDAIHGAIEEYKSFSTTLMILFIVEILLVMIYFFLMPFVNNRIFPEKVSLISDPVLLNVETPLQMPEDISNNFAISMWVYLNPGSINKPSYSVESPIFSFMNKKDKPHIRITYSNIDKGNNDFIVYIGEQQYPMSLPLQKWHHFVFNHTTYAYVKPGASVATTSPSIYTSMASSSPPPSVKHTTVDLFVNGNLERSFTYEHHIPVISPTLDKLYIGNSGLDESSISIAADGVEGANGRNSNREGLYGAVCNVMYYKKPLTKMAIIYHYNLYIIQNPPV